MGPVRRGELPASALLRKYREQGAYTDCYVTDVDRRVSHAAFVETFYTTALFKLERLILAAFVARPSSDEQTKELAQGARNEFAAWRVEGRDTDQLLLTDFMGSTRSWLMVVPLADQRTRLYFGSAVVPRLNERTGQREMGLGFRLLLGFHKLYSRALLASARRRLRSAPAMR